LFIRILPGENKSAFRAFVKIKFLPADKIIGAFEVLGYSFAGTQGTNAVTDHLL
jgi:hypothetical protein